MLSFVSVYPEGIRFRVLSETQWSFSDITCVDAQEAFGQVRLTFSARHRQSALEVVLPDPPAACQLLQALPPSLTMTLSAIEMRDGHTIRN